ncbi:MAG TPA: TonB-dependent receptor [Bryobacteraceae bacterium]|nr:TonB-dependent receptor [Bryobacteraceae bacterium]
MSGRVVDENGAPVRGARVAVRLTNAAAATSMAGPWQAQTDPDGAFALSLPGTGDFLVSVEREGYYTLRDRPLHVETAPEVTLVLNSIREVFQSVDVAAETSPLEVAETQHQERLSGTEVNDIPFANSHSLRNSLRLIPDVVEDTSGNLHVNGAAENQVLYLLNGFNLTDPISGQFQTLLAVEGIRSVDLSSGRYSPEFGKGTAGAMAINTESGTDAFHYTATDFVPGLNIQHGLRIGNWFPRFGVSGPIVRGRAWFSDTFDSEYTQTLVTGLPKDQNTRHGWAGSNLLHTQVNLTTSNILFADFLVNVDNQGRVGLGPLDPVPATSTVHASEYFGSLKDQVYVGHGMLVEFGYAHNDFSNAQAPQGTGLYLFSPEGNGGNYFVNATQGASRDQGLVHAYLPQFHFAGPHQVEAGADADEIHYNADSHRTGYEVLGLSGQLISQTLFPTPAIFHVTNTELSSYVLDTWRLSKRLQLKLGIRQDWDRRIDNLAWSPRLGFSWSPFASDRTRVSGGYALTHDAVTMDVLGRPLDQAAITTLYNANGTPAGPPAPTTFTLGSSPLALPRAVNWNLDIDHQLTDHIYLTAKYLRRRGTDGFAFVNTAAPDAPPSLLPLPSADAAGVYQLTNLRRDDYDSVQISIRQTLSGQYEWMAAYTRSRARSNALLDPNIAQPLQVLPDFVPMPWDAPNRLMAWAYFPLPWKNWAVSALADMRAGFPFSVQNQSGLIVGAVDSYRYPLNLDLNLAIERMVTVRGYRFALRGGMDNISDRANPTAVNNVIGAPQYLQFLGDEGRHFVVRVRFFGRAQGK